VIKYISLVRCVEEKVERKHLARELSVLFTEKGRDLLHN